MLHLLESVERSGAMLELTGKVKDLTVSPFEKRAVLMIEVNECSDIIEAYDELKQLDKLSIVLKKWRQSRSKNANAYMWVLCDKLGKKIGINKEEVYLTHIRSVGVFRAVELPKDAAPTIFTAWRRLGIGWVADEISEVDGKVSALLYYGSSTYNTVQMSRLINSIVEECKEQGVQTMTPDEIANMLSLWKEEKIEC